MHFIKTSGFGLQEGEEITSFRHAIMIMGFNKLFRWAELQLDAPEAPAGPAR